MLRRPWCLAASTRTTPSRTRPVSSELYIAGDRAKAFLDMLKRQQELIEQELGYPLEWEEMRQDCRISVQLKEADPDNAADWPRQHEWLAKRLNDLHRVLASRVGALDADERVPDSE